MDVFSKRERAKFVHNGYSFVFDKNTKDDTKKMWRCDRKHHGCKARIHTDIATDAVVVESGDHNHPSNAAGIEVAAAVGRMKRRATDTQDGNATFLYFNFFALVKLKGK